MKIKITFFLLLFVIFTINTSELRLRSMSGISSLGLYVVPDDWCDPFFVNPAYAPENNKLLINFYDKFYFNMSQEEYIQNIDNDPFEYSYKTSEKLIDFKNDFIYGMLIPINYFILGFNINFNSEYYKRAYERRNIEEDFDESDEDYFDSISLLNYCNLSINSLFSWEIKENINIGFIVGVDSVLYKNGERYSGSVSTNSNETPLNIFWNTNFGLLFKKESLSVSISLPFTFNYFYETEHVNSYNMDIYQFEKYSGTVFLRTVFDISITDEIFFRIPVELGFGYSVYSEKYSVDSSYEDDTYYYYKKYDIPIKCAFSVNNKINEKVLIFYGLDTQFEYYKEYLDVRTDDTDNLYSEDYNSFELNVGTFIGGEFNLLKWLDLRAGFNTILLKYSKYKKYNTLGLNIYNFDIDILDVEKYNIYKNSIQFLVNANISTGLAFKPKDYFTIELAANFLIFTPEISDEESEFSYNMDIIETENRNLFNFTFGFDLGFVFKIGKKMIMQMKK